MRLTFELSTDLSPQKIWPMYAEITNWYKWESDLESISLEGDFATGTFGQMTLLGQPPLRFELTEVRADKSFCDKTVIPKLGDLYFYHELILRDGNTSVRHSVELIPIEGLDLQKGLDFLQQVFADVPASVSQLVEASR